MTWIAYSCFKYKTSRLHLLTVSFRPRQGAMQSGPARLEERKDAWHDLKGLLLVAVHILRSLRQTPVIHQTLQHCAAMGCTTDHYHPLRFQLQHTLKREGINECFQSHLLYLCGDIAVASRLLHCFQHLLCQCFQKQVTANPTAVNVTIDRSIMHSIASCPSQSTASDRHQPA